jgi:hypothetical protein
LKIEDPITYRYVLYQKSEDSPYWLVADLVLEDDYPVGMRSKIIKEKTSIKKIQRMPHI